MVESRRSTQVNSGHKGQHWSAGVNAEQIILYKSNVVHTVSGDDCMMMVNGS